MSGGEVFLRSPGLLFQPINSPPVHSFMRKSGFTLVELMIVVAIIGLLSAVAIPNFLKFQARTKQSEPKANLKALFVAQRTYFMERDAYTSSVSLLSWVPERGNRYFVVTGCAQLSSRALAAENVVAGDCGFGVDVFKGFNALNTAAITNITATAATAFAGTCAPAANVGCVSPGNNGAFLAMAAGNVDNDATLDTWAVSSMTIAVAANAAVGSEAEAQFNGGGIPANNINDVR